MTVQADLILQIHLFPSDYGGRRSSTPTNGFKCLFKVFDEYFDCQLVLDESGPLNPGQTATVPARLLSPDLVAGRVTKGQAFKLCEGRREVGEGTIVEVLSATCRKQ
jgi:hypothetical protein